MKFELPPLPYPKEALAPAISPRTVDIHFEKHHRGYMEKLEKAIGDTPLAKEDLEDIIRKTDGQEFNLAAQVWNHTFYWMSLSPDGGGEPPAEIADALSHSFGDVARFRKELAEAATGEFGSGWAWLIERDPGELAVISSSDAENPLTSGANPLLTIDVWEHAYYLDYQNDREAYVRGVIDSLLNWDCIAQRLRSREAGRKAG